MPHTRPGLHLDETDRRRLHELRQARKTGLPGPAPVPLGARIADTVAATVGSWRFIILQSMVLGAWIILNITAYVANWDPYPFILLNLVLSFQAAYAAPIIMMSQNRQSEIDRRNAENDYRVNEKAELEIELLHAKVDALREQEIVRLTKIIEQLTRHLAPEVAETIIGKPVAVPPET